MPTVTPVTAAGYVLYAGYLADAPVFLSADGSVVLGTEGQSRQEGQSGPEGHGGPEGRRESIGGGVLAAVRDLDGRSLVTGGDDGRVCRLHADGSVTVIAEKPRKWIDQVAVGPSGAVAFASGRTVWVREASAKEHELVRPRAVGGLAFFPKGLRVAIAGYNGVGLWFPGTTAPPQELEWKGSHIAVTLSPDGANVVTSMQENALHGWRLKDGQHMRMSGYPVKVKSLSWSMKGRYLASSGAGAAICWPFHYKDGPMGKRPLELGPRQELVTQVACHPSEEIAALGYEDGMVLLVRFSDGEEVLMRRPGDGGPVTALGWNRTGLELAFGTEAGAAGVIDLAG